MLFCSQTLFQDRIRYSHFLCIPHFSSRGILLFTDLRVRSFWWHFYCQDLLRRCRYLSRSPSLRGDPCDLMFIFGRCRGSYFYCFEADGYLRSRDLCRAKCIRGSRRMRLARLILALGSGTGWNGRTCLRLCRRDHHLLLIPNSPFIINQINIYQTNESVFIE